MSGGRRCGSSRVYSMKPVVFPMFALLACDRRRRRKTIAYATLRRHHFLLVDSQHALVLVREDFNEFAHHLRPVLEDPFSARASRRLEVRLDQRLQEFLIVALYLLQVDPRRVAPLLREVSLLIE